MNLKSTIVFIWIAVSLFFVKAHSEISDQKNEIKSFLLEFYNSSEKKDKDYSKLLYAIEKGYRNIAFMLLETESPNYISKTKATTSPFMLAIMKEDEELVFAMLNHKANVNLKAYFPMEQTHTSPLYVAVKSNHSSKITKVLCDNKAKIILDKQWTISNPLGVAIKNIDKDKFMILANTLSDSELSKIDSTGNNLLTIGVSNGFGNLNKQQKQHSVDISEYLIKRGVALETLFASSLDIAIKNGNDDLFNFLLYNGANIDFVSKGDISYVAKSGYNNPIISAIHYYKDKAYLDKNALKYRGDLPEKLYFLDVLLEAGANANVDLPLSLNPLSMAAELSLHDVIEYLMANGSEIDRQDGTGRTPLIRAVENNDCITALVLLKLGATPTKKGSNNKTPIEIALSKGYLEVFNILVEAESNMIH